MISLIRRVRSLAAEMKRRKVFRVAAVYAGTAFLVVQVAAIWLEALDLPSWTLKFIIVLASLGFPIALVLAWAFESTPEGMTVSRWADEPAEDGGPGRPSGERANAPAGAATLPSPAPVAPHPAPPAAPPAERSIAVLSFSNLTADVENDYLSEGFTEEIVDALAQIPDLRVASRTSAGAFKGRAEDVRQIGASLGVSTVLEGSIRRSGNRLRLRAQLTEVATGFQIWSQIFERELDDLFAIQDEISRAIADSLRLKLPRSAIESVERRRTDNLDAYQSYLKGRYHWNRRTEAGLHEAVEEFGEAVRLDPEYALAFAGLADSWSLLLDYGYAAPAEALAAADAAATRALQLDPLLSEAHTSIALVRQFSWDWAGAAQAFTRSLELDPDNAVARHRYALLLTWIGRHGDALQEIEKARALEPNSSIVNASIGLIRYHAREFERARADLTAACAQNPDFAPAHLFRGAVLSQLNRGDEAIDAIGTAIRLAGEGPAALAMSIHAYGRAGRVADAQGPMDRLRAMADGRYVPPFYYAIAALGLGDRETALARLEEAYAARSNHLAYLGTDPQMDELRSEPRFQELVKKVGLSAGSSRPVLAATI